MVRMRLWEDGLKVWFRDEHWHRANGPAIDRPNGDQEWWWYDREVTEFEHMMIVAQEHVNG